MNIVIDYREKDLYLLLNKLNTNLTFTISSQNIELGDIQFHLNELCCLIIERKTVADFAASIQDGRYREQAHRLSASNVHNHQIFYLIEGNIFNFKSKYSRITSTTMYSALLTTSLFKGFSIWNTQSLQETCTIIIQWANKIHKEQTKLPYYNNINHKDNDLKTDKYIECIKITKKSKTNDNIGKIMLMQIPGISASISLQLLNPFNGNIYQFLKKIAEDNNYLETIKIKGKKGSERKLGKNIIESIRKIIL